jgi:dTDP-4-amino-4,6-dideoxygalactose transaminase
MDRPLRQSLLTFGAPHVEEEEIREVVDSLRSGWLGSGPKVARFEERFRDYTGAGHAVAVSSCSAALHLSLLAAGIGPGDEVITCALTFCATAHAVEHVGARPVLVDCDRRTQTLDPAQVEAAITPATRAVLPVHFAGRPCDLDAIGALAARHDLVVIEDAAHAIEARFRGRKIGSVSPFTCFSFYATKNVATGEGGMVTVPDAGQAETLRILRNHGLSRDALARHDDAESLHYEVVARGFKYNLTDLAAGLGLHQLARVDEGLRRRQAVWARYDAAFADLPVDTPAPEEPGTLHARHLYTLMVDRERAGLSRDELARRLRARRIGTGVHYVAVHLQPYYRKRYGLRPEAFPESTWISERTLSLPLSAGLSDDDVEDVVSAVRDALGA